MKPCNDLILVRLSEEEKRSFLMPDTAEKEQKSDGIIEAVGPKVEVLKIGDKVLYGKFAGETVEEKDSVTYQIIKESEVLATL